MAPARRRAIGHGLALWGVVATVGVWLALVSDGSAIDAHAYWINRPPVTYSALPGTDDAYLYSPAFAQLIAPLTALPWQVFLALWSGAILLVLAAITGPRLLLPALVLTMGEAQYANVHYLMAGVCLIASRAPWTWGLMLLTKITPGIGVLWFAGRREWRKLGIAVGVSAAVVGASFALDPAQWVAWYHFLGDNAGLVPPNRLLPLPIWAGISIAAALVLWGGRTDRRWTIPVAVVIALPHGTIGLAVLVALIPTLVPSWRGSWLPAALGPAIRGRIRSQLRTAEAQHVSA